MKHFTTTTGLVLAAFMLASTLVYGETDIAQHLQDVSVTIKASGEFGGGSEGSGVLITREVKLTNDGLEAVTINFVWTAAHVVDGLRSTRMIIGANGQKRTVVEFRDAQIVKELVEEGRTVGEFKMHAKVILYSDSEEGHDLALLMVRKRSFVSANAEFQLGETPVAIGTRLVHVGSLLGQAGANSMTDGIMSQIGRVLQLGSGDGTIFDQTTVNAFPGSSGGGVFLTNGKYVGMLVRGAGETFNLVVPVRRMQEWAKERDIAWALDAKAAVPCLADLYKLKIEDEELGKNNDRSDDSKKFDFAIYEQE